MRIGRESGQTQSVGIAEENMARTVEIRFTCGHDIGSHIFLFGVEIATD